MTKPITHAYCAYFDGYCKIISAPDLPDIQKEKAKWIKKGADEIRLLPVEEAKSEFYKWLDKQKSDKVDLLSNPPT